ncbi:hypothetical protein [Algihabitans albus]|uniref:hypothetical protein n=1 Tax=Algihabitans albus TaxID=2164067 RepID=UPI000E5CBAD7|nr:hypothetical protein [Algihabitans albus]
MKYLSVGVVVLLTGCVSDGTQILNSIGSVFETNRPQTAQVSSELPIVQGPESFGDFQTTSLIDGRNRSYDVQSYGNGVRVRQDDGCVWTRNNDWFSPSDSWANCGTSKNWNAGQAQVRQLDSLYPLRVGSEGRYRREATSHTGRSRTRETVCKVTGAVDVIRPGLPDTPAYVVKCDDSKRVRTTWYAPGEGPVAFTQVSDSRGLEESWIRKD